MAFGYIVVDDENGRPDDIPMEATMNFRFPIASLMIMVLFFGLGLAALRTPTEARASLVFTGTVFVLLTATLGASVRRSWTWGGFALFGWASLALAFGPTEEATPAPRPLSTLTLEALLPTIRPAAQDGYSTIRNVTSVIGVSVAGKVVVAPVAYLQIGHCLLSLLAGLVGGIAAHLLPDRGGST